MVTLIRLSAFRLSRVSQSWSSPITNSLCAGWLIKAGVDNRSQSVFQKDRWINCATNDSCFVTHPVVVDAEWGSLIPWFLDPQVLFLRFVLFEYWTKVEGVWGLDWEVFFFKIFSKKWCSFWQSCRQRGIYFFWKRSGVWAPSSGSQILG